MTCSPGISAREEHFMEHIFLVPVRMSTPGMLTLRTGRLDSGERTGLAFTSEASLARALGPSHHWTSLAREALAGMLAPLGIKHITVDPDQVGEPYIMTRISSNGVSRRCMPGPTAAAA
jgi:hypothetical protein